MDLNWPRLADGQFRVRYPLYLVIASPKTIIWPNCCACCLEPAAGRIALRVSLFSDTSDPRFQVPYCSDCLRHGFFREPRFLTQSQLKTLEASFSGCAAFRCDSGWGEFHHGVKPHWRTVTFELPVTGQEDRTGKIRFEFIQFEYARRFAQENRLDWTAIAKQNQPEIASGA